MDNQGAPYQIGLNGTVQKLRRLSLSGDESGEYTEKWLQELLFYYPDILPVREIEPSFHSLIPICRELSTEVGFVDVLYVTPAGGLVICEVKLWRNPEARRKVVGQVLDYASELSRWTYEDLQRELRRTSGKGGNVLFDMVREKFPDADERMFCDAVSRNLRIGKFLLLIVGDGIREGTRQITDYLNEKGNMAFSLGLVEVKIYGFEDGSRLVVPSIYARTEILSRTIHMVVSKDVAPLDESEEIEDGFEDRDARLQKRRDISLAFWTDVLKDLKLDDPSQPMAKPRQGNHVAFNGFSSDLASVKAWYATDKNDEAGVYLRIPKSTYSDALVAYLSESMDQLRAEVGDDLRLKHRSDGSYSFGIARQFNDVVGKDREGVVSLQRVLINRFVNAFRHRIRRFSEDSIKPA